MVKKILFAWVLVFFATGLLWAFIIAPASHAESPIFKAAIICSSAATVLALLICWIQYREIKRRDAAFFASSLEYFGDLAASKRAEFLSEEE